MSEIEETSTTNAEETAEEACNTGTEESATEEVRDIKIYVVPALAKTPRSFRLRKLYSFFLARYAEVEELMAKNENKGTIERLKLIRDYHLLMEKFLRHMCRVEGGTIEEALENISADEADRLFGKATELVMGTRFFAISTNGNTPAAS